MNCGESPESSCGEAICERFMQQMQPLRCRARNIPASTKFANCFMQQGPVQYLDVYVKEQPGIRNAGIE